jgi:hypothetical protein
MHPSDIYFAGITLLAAAVAVGGGGLVGVLTTLGIGLIVYSAIAAMFYW